MTAWKLRDPVLQLELEYRTFCRELGDAIDMAALGPLSHEELVWFESDWTGEHRSMAERISDLEASRRVGDAYHAMTKPR